METWKDTNFKVGDLVRDKLNMGDESYGLGLVVAVSSATCIQDAAKDQLFGKRYDIYFNKFGRTITFHGDYLEKV